MNIKLSFYKYISSLKRPKSYTGKIFLIAFIGTHIPLISVFIYLVFLAPIEGRLSILLTLLIATLVGTAATLYLIYRLLAPILLTNEAITKYYSDKVIPDLPVMYTDEAGELMKNTQECISQLDDLLKLKNRLIAMVSHDSKTPLGSIKIANSLIKDEIESESPNVDDILKYIELIEISTRSHSEFLDNMLNLARFDDGKIQLNKEEVSPKELYQKLKQNHEFYFSTKDIDFVMSSTLSETVSLNIDKDKMMSVLNNLIQNAIKFTEESGVIELKVERKDERHLIQIIDNGIGISEERKKSIFEAFSSSSRGTKSEIGSGLGLWIVKVFTDLHDGEVYFDTKEGEGTTFTISLPAG
ncbi:MAG: HAMP domain-containing histidine kinase [Balneola sp.]